MSIDSLRDKVKNLASEYLEDVISWRRHLHSNPELSFEEKNTSKYVEEKLTGFGIPVQTGVANYGLIGIIEGIEKGDVVALRADMDALPILEENDAEYISKNKGVMHACGHDAHTASLLGAAKILNETKDSWTGTIKLLFQPAEEKIPGGALQMIKEGALKNPDAQNIIGQHVFPLLEAGKVGFRSGMYMASADELHIKVIGKGGHAAVPEHSIDPVLISSHLIVALQQVISRRSSPKKPSVLSIGKVIANGATNVIPNEVTIAGTFRAMDEEWRTEAHEIIEKMATQLVESMGGKCIIDIKKGYPYLENHPELTESTRLAAIEYLGAENVVDLDLWMAGEDFAYFSHEIPACFYRFGTRNEKKGIVSPVHTSTFDIDEDSLKIGMGFLAWSAINSLELP